MEIVDKDFRNGFICAFQYAVEKSTQFYLYIRILVHDFNSKLDKAM